MFYPSYSDLHSITSAKLIRWVYAGTFLKCYSIRRVTANIFACLFLIIISTRPVMALVETASGITTTPKSSNKIFIKLKSKTSSQKIKSVSAKVGNAEFQGSVTNADTLVYKIKSGDTDKTIMEALKDPNVESAFPVPVFSALEIVQSDRYKNNQWGLDNMKIRGAGDAAWNLFTDTANLGAKTDSVTVAVVDSGVDATHPDLVDKITKSVTCLSGNCVSGGTDDFGHGTHVAGIIAAEPDGEGVAGSGWGTKILSVKVLGADGLGDMDVILNSFNWIADHAQAENIKIVNMSLGGSVADQNAINLINATVANLQSKGIVVIAAAGNDGDNGNPVFYPAAANNVLSVAALDRNNNLSYYSEYNISGGNNWVSVAAPGGSCSSPNPKEDCILSDYPSAKTCGGLRYPETGVTNFCYMQGTSMAAPLVSGLAALMLAKNNSLTGADIKRIIENTANASIVSGKTLHGGVDGFRAVQAAGSQVNPTVTPSPTTGSNPTATPSPSPTSIPAGTSAGLYCVPSTGTYKVGDLVSIDIYLNTYGNNVYGTKVSAGYSASLLESKDVSIPVTSYTHWTNPIINSNIVIDSSGSITFDYGNSQNSFKGNVPIGQIKFKAKAPGLAQFYFNFQQQYDDTTPGVSQIWGKRDGVNLSNILTDVYNCVYIIEDAPVNLYPTTGPAKLPKIAPGTYPYPYFCPQTDIKNKGLSCVKKSMGDSNCDGIVDDYDYMQWSYEFDQYWPSTLWNKNANFVCNEGNTSTYFVDLTDFEAWRRNAVSLSIPISTPTVPVATNTPVPPTHAPVLPTATSVPPTSTPRPPTVTIVPPSSTPSPTSPLPSDCWRCPGPNCDKCGCSGNWCSSGGCTDFCNTHPGDCQQC
jgi:subtilisin family serine protease